MRTSLLRAVRGGQLQPKPAFVDREADGIRLRAAGGDYFSPAIRFPNGESDVYPSLAACALQAEADGIELIGCASCVRFRFSGMSQQLSEGFSGYCTLAGFRRTDALVNVDHGCGEYAKVQGWPGDLDAAFRDRAELSDREPTPSRQSAFEGSIVGLAVGDALGFPAEFLHRDAILRAFGPGGIRDFASAPAGHPPGTYTDDTQMSLAVAEALVESGRGDLDTLMSAMAARFVSWSRSPANDRSPGTTTMIACGRLAHGVSWREAGVAGSKGCGSAMRVAPIGLFFWRDLPRLLETARTSSLITHGHDAAVQGAASAALLVALALAKRSPQQMFDALMEHCAPHSADLRTALDKLPHFLDSDPADALSARGLGLGWVAEEAVVSALYCFWRSPLDFEACVTMAANTDGDSDSIASIAGGICGAFNGLGAIPERWRANVENAAGLIDLARRLCNAAGS